MGIYESLLAMLTAVAGFGFFLCLHVIIWRLPGFRSKSFRLMLILAAVAYGAGLAFAWWSSRPDIEAHFWVSASFYSLLLLLYLHFYSGILRSVSVRILEALVNSKKGKLTLHELDSVYSKSGMVEKRLSALVRNGWLNESDGRYTCEPKGVRFARLASLLARVYGLEKTG